VTDFLWSIEDENGSGREVLAGPGLGRARHGHAFDAFYTSEYSSLVALAHVLTGSSGHAEDVAQEAMLAAYRRWDEVGEMDFPAAWVRRVCANIATSVVRRKIVEARALLTLRRRSHDVRVLDDSAFVFWGEVRRLPRRQAQCLALFYVYGCSVKETANALGCSEGTVKSHLARGRTALAPRLDIIDEEAVR
jgi:RNA polymerase sigma-70 factor, ECF subfamily